MSKPKYTKPVIQNISDLTPVAGFCGTGGADGGCGPGNSAGAGGCNSGGSTSGDCTNGTQCFGKCNTGGVVFTPGMPQKK